MENIPVENELVEAGPEKEEKPRKIQNFWRKLPKVWLLLVLITYIFGVGSGWMIHELRGAATGGSGENASGEHRDLRVLLDEFNPPDGVKLPVRYGDIGPRLLAAGAVDYQGFVKIYQEIGQPLDKEQIDILTKGSNQEITIRKENAQFLLNLFWALGLANRNAILTEGPMMKNGKEGAMNLASTGGWTLAKKPIAELYASEPIVTLTEEQQKRVAEVAINVYRPCCDNPTHFPDCNHGMAMLGLLELMAAQGANVDEMFAAAKAVNAFWFPQQTLELATAFKVAQNMSFSEVEAREWVSMKYSSGSGAQAVRQFLAQNGLQGGNGGGGSCGVK